MIDSITNFIKNNESKRFTNYPDLPAGPDWKKSNWILWESKLPWLKLNIVAPFKEMLEEAISLRHRFVEHRSNNSKGWSSLSIHGIGAEITGTPESHGLSSDSKFDWTEVAQQCPVTVDYFKNHFPFREYKRLRFMLLEAGGYIEPHSDNQQNSLATAVNISLNNPDDCRMITEYGVVPFENTGSVFSFNNHYQHCVVNDSSQDRYHIIVHGIWKSPEWDQLVIDSYNTTSV